jgi:hypothetical protein
VVFNCNLVSSKVTEFRIRLVVTVNVLSSLPSFSAETHSLSSVSRFTVDRFSVFFHEKLFRLFLMCVLRFWFVFVVAFVVVVVAFDMCACVCM